MDSNAHFEDVIQPWLDIVEDFIPLWRPTVSSPPRSLCASIGASGLT